MIGYCEKDDSHSVGISASEYYGSGVAKDLVLTTQGETICQERMRPTLREKKAERLTVRQL